MGLSNFNQGSPYSNRQTKVATLKLWCCLSVSEAKKSTLRPQSPFFDRTREDARCYRSRTFSCRYLPHYNYYQRKQPRTLNVDRTPFDMNRVLSFISDNCALLCRLYGRYLNMNALPSCLCLPAPTVFCVDDMRWCRIPMSGFQSMRWLGNIVRWSQLLWSRSLLCESSIDLIAKKVCHNTTIRIE